MNLSESSKQAIAVNKAHHRERSLGWCMLVIVIASAFLCVVKGVYEISGQYPDHPLVVTIKVASP